MAGLIVATAMLGVVGLLGYVWKHRTGVMARGIGAAGAKYNELYGQGGPPQIPPPAAHRLVERDDGDSSQRPSNRGHG